MTTTRWIAGIIGIFALTLAGIVRIGATASTAAAPEPVFETHAAEATDHQHQAPAPVAAAEPAPGTRCASDRPAVPRFVTPPAALPVPEGEGAAALNREIVRTVAERIDDLELEAQRSAVQTAAVVSNRLRLSADESARLGREVADLHRRGKEIGDNLRSGAIRPEVAEQLLARHQAESTARIETLLGPARFALLDQLTPDEPPAGSRSEGL
jgi:hypothetical protein